MRETEEVSQVVGVRTRAMTKALAAAEKEAKKKKTLGSPAAAYQIAYLQLRSRCLVRISGSRNNSDEKFRERSISFNESNASCDVAADSWWSGHQAGSQNSGSVMHFSSFGHVSETNPSSNYKEEDRILESRAVFPSQPQRSTGEISIEAEVDEFLAEAEMKEAQRFAIKYNFDIVKEVPLKGRYQWIKI